MGDDKEAAIKRIEEKQGTYKRLFTTEEGKEILADLERDCYLRTSTFSTDAMEMAYREGMRSMVLHIKSMLDMDIEQFKKLNAEQGEERHG